MYEELNKKLAEWAGFQVTSENSFVDNNGITQWLDFTQSLDACFKWLVPEGNVAVLIAEHHQGGKVFTQATVNKEWVDFIGAKVEGTMKDKAALALCLAIEKLIDGK